MDSENDKILYVETVDKHEVGLKSPNMEREAFKRSMQYRIAQNFGGRKHWQIWRLRANSPKFYPPKFSITLVFYRCSAHSANVFSAKYILGANPPKFSTAKVLYHTVSD